MGRVWTRGSRAAVRTRLLVLALALLADRGCAPGPAGRPPAASWEAHMLSGLRARDEGRIDEARRQLEMAAELVRQSGENDAALAARVEDVAHLYRSRGELATAEPLYRTALSIKERGLGATHLEVATTLNNLGEVYYAAERPADAEPLFRRALEIIENGRGPDHPSAATVMNNLAAVYDAQRRDRDAEELYLRSIAILEGAFGPDHESLGTGLQNLALFYHDRGRLNDALPLYQRALRVLGRRSAPGDATTAVLQERYRTLEQEMAKAKEMHDLNARFRASDTITSATAVTRREATRAADTPEPAAEATAAPATPSPTSEPTPAETRARLLPTSAPAVVPPPPSPTSPPRVPIVGTLPPTKPIPLPTATPTQRPRRQEPQLDQAMAPGTHPAPGVGVSWRFASGWVKRIA